MLLAHLVLAGAVGLLLAAGSRAALRLSTDPLPCLLAAVAIAATAATVEALALGLLHLGTNRAALFAAAATTYLAARLLIKRPAASLSARLLGSWNELSLGSKCALGALIGACLAWTVWLLRYPIYDWDNLVYHIPEVVAWVHNGQPGSIVTVVPGAPYANLPVTNEVLLAWGSGVARSFVWVTIWPGLMVALLAVAGWIMLRAVRVPTWTAAIATASLCSAPMLTSFQGNGANSDLPAVVWLVVAAALCATARRPGNAGLLVPALLAGALSIGTKTTTAPYVVVVLVVTSYGLRSELRALKRPLVVAALAALAVGGSWYIRNLLQHGTPFWPYFSTPWGDPLPKFPNSTFFDHPIASLNRFGDPGYVTDTFLGALIVLASGLVAALVIRRRAFAACAALTVVGVFLWTFAPSTGAPPASFPAADAFHGAIRYLIPAVATAGFAVALAVRYSRPPLSTLWNGVLLVALAINVVQLFALGRHRVPALSVPIGGALIGALVALAVRARWTKLVPGFAVAAAALVALAAALSSQASGLTQRHERAAFADASLISWFAGPGSDDRKIYTAPVALVMLSRDNLAREVDTLPRRATCGSLRSHLESGWLVVEKLNTDALLGPSTIWSCVTGWHPVYEDASNLVYDGQSVAQVGLRRRFARR